MTEPNYVFERKLEFTLVFRNTKSTVEAKKKMAVMLSAMRQQANKCNWFYKTFIVIYEDGEQIKAQLLIYGLPILTIREWIYTYFLRLGKVETIKPISDTLSLLLINHDAEFIAQERGELA